MKERGNSRSAWRLVLVAMGSVSVGCAGEAPEVQAGLEAPAAPRYDLQPAEIGVHEAAAQVAAVALAGCESLGEDAPQDGDAFHDELLAVLEVYLEGTREAFEAHALGQELDVTWVGRLADEGTLAAVWATKSRTLRGAPLETGGVRVRLRSQGGRELTYLDATTVVLAERPDRVPWLGAGTEGSTDIYEVIVPAEMAASKDGASMTFAGRFGLWLAYHREFGRWVLLKLAIYDAPDGTSLGMPPL